MFLRKLWILLSLVVVGMVASITAYAIDSTSVSLHTVKVENPDGASIGTVIFKEAEAYVQVVAKLSGLTPGLHGFHIHEFGRCEISDDGAFLSAGGHYDTVDADGDKAPHGNHAGDLPMLLVLEDGTAYLSFYTDRFIMSDLMDVDGSSVIVHAGVDNYANIPERYGGPDETTLSAGDSGPRVGCGVVAPPQK